MQLASGKVMVVWPRVGVEGNVQFHHILKVELVEDMGKSRQDSTILGLST